MFHPAQIANGKPTIMKFIIFLFTIINTSFAFSSTDDLLGQWQYRAENEIIKILMKVDIKTDETHFSLQCIVGQNQGEVKAVTPTLINADKYKIVKSIDKSIAVGGFDCRLRILEDVYNYDINENQMKLVDSKGNPIFFERISKLLNFNFQQFVEN